MERAFLPAAYEAHLERRRNPGRVQRLSSHVPLRLAERTTAGMPSSRFGSIALGQIVGNLYNYLQFCKSLTDSD